jgi:hypothetical protein
MMSDNRRARPWIILEFNELCPELLRQWVDDGRLPQFKAFYDASQVFLAGADATEADYLEPWIQWYSVHTGLDCAQHGVFHLTDGPAAGHLDVWRALIQAGYRVASFASMNAKGFASPGSLFLPDPWCTSESPYPPALAAYQDVIRTKVQENSNGQDESLGKKAYLDLLRFLMAHGLQFSTVASIVRQVASELASGGVTSWRRAVLLDRLQFDLFHHYWLRDRYDFATFFLNSTAHYQHAYWHLAFPEDFPVSPRSGAGDDPKRDAILFGYLQMDRMLARFRRLEERGAMLVLSTALSQQPNPAAGRCYYRPRDVVALLNRLGVRPLSLMPVMAEQFTARFSSPSEAEAARTALSRLTFDGQSVFYFDPAPEGELFFGSRVRHRVPVDATVEFGGDPPQGEPFCEVFYELPHTKSATHHPESALWFKTGTHRVHAEKVSILDILPTALDYYDVPVPDEPSLVRRGRSLLPELDLTRYPLARYRVPEVIERHLTSATAVGDSESR